MFFLGFAYVFNMEFCYGHLYWYIKSSFENKSLINIVCVCFVSSFNWIFSGKRKPSCVNERGIPPAAYQSNPGGGHPILTWPGGTPSWCGWGDPSRPGLGYPPPKGPGTSYLGKNLGLGTPWKGPGTSDLGKNLGLGYPPPSVVNKGRTLPSLSLGCGR